MSKLSQLLFLGYALASNAATGGVTSAEDNRIYQRVDALLARMSLEDKIGQLVQQAGTDASTGVLQDYSNQIEDVKAGRVGSILNIAGADKIRALQQLAVENSPHHIPLLFGYDVLRGYRTTFPVPLGEAASWDLAAIEGSARIAAVEASNEGIGWTFAPMVDIARDARWGRVMEGAGEDPYLGSLIAVARVNGFQGRNFTQSGAIAACAKHFAADGAAVAGRDYNTVDMSETELREIYLRPFKAAAEAGCLTFMNAFNEISGVPSTANGLLNRTILKGEWNWPGFIVSDWGSVGQLIAHGFAKDGEQAAELSVNAGCDMDMCSNAYRDHLGKLVKQGRVDPSLIEDACRRILYVKFKLGLFDDPYKFCKNDPAISLSAEHRAHARDMARKSFVLLQNEGQILPLSKKTPTIAVIGPLADNRFDPMVSWSALGDQKHTITLLQGLRNALGDTARIVYEKGCDITEGDRSGFSRALEAAREADVVIAAMGEPGDYTGENRNRTELRLPGLQEQLIDELAGTGKPVVVMLYCGRPLVLSSWQKKASAILCVWQPGTEGGNAIADVVFGDMNPSGKLPVSFPYATGQVPVYYNHKSTGKPYQLGVPWTTRYLDCPNDPLYPFGYGLSYSSFAYAGLALSSRTLDASSSLTVSVEVSNKGLRDGEEVVQLYVRDLVGSLTRPVKELKGFKKIMLKAGETAKVSFTLSSTDLAYWTRSLEYKAEPGEFKVFVGGSSAATLEQSFVLN